MRVYLPASFPLLRSWYDDAFAVCDIGFAVTAVLRESYHDGDLEELEWVAQQSAAQASLRLLAADPDASRRRVVLAIDADEALARSPQSGIVAGGSGGRDPSTVIITGPVPKSAWASVLADDPAAALPATTDGAAIAAAIEVVRRGGGGHADPDGQDRLDDAEAIELAWWAIQELPALLDIS